MLTGKVGPTGLPKRGLPGETEGGPMQDAGGFFRMGRGLDNRREAETCMQESLTGDGSGWCARRDAPVYGQG